MTRLTVVFAGKEPSSEHAPDPAPEMDRDSIHYVIDLITAQTGQVAMRADHTLHELSLGNGVTHLLFPAENMLKSW